LDAKKNHGKERKIATALLLCRQYNWEKLLMKTKRIVCPGLGLLISTCILIVGFGCAPYLYQSYTESHSEIMEKPECNDTLSDSSVKSLAQNPSRSAYIIKQAIVKNEQALVVVLKNDSIFNRQDTLRINLSLSPNGYFTLTQVRKKIKLDSLHKNRLDGIIKAIKLDSIPNYPLYFHSSILVDRHNNKFRLSVPDSCKYYCGRSRKSIMSTVMLDIVYLRYAYNWRLRQQPGIKGKITVMFAINERGEIIFVKKLESTANDTGLEDDVVRIVKKWKFCPINNPGDIVEVVYPFVFSQ
jgi:TonB family protein